MKEISHGSIIPLSGGMSVGAKQAFGKDPDWALSWGAFGKNESHFKKNFSDVPFMTLESEEIDQVDLSSLSKVDVIHSVPPCSALSSLNSSWNNPKMKGSNAESTKWMHYSTEIALGKLKPKVFIFENAPGLLQKAGEEMRSYLIEKAKRHNYSISFLFTDSLLHGIPQSRKRTFVFFWNTPEKTPSFVWTKKDYLPLDQYITGKDDGSEEYNMYSFSSLLTDDPFYKFAKHKLGDNWRSIKHKTIGQWVWKEGLIDEMIFYTDDSKAKRILHHWKAKVADGKGFWDSTPLLFKDHANAVIAKNIGMIHPHEDRYLNIRELMDLMALPKDYKLNLNEEKNIVGGFNILCQSVPSSTAKDMFSYIGKVLNDEVSYKETSVLYGNNITTKEWV